MAARPAHRSRTAHDDRGFLTVAVLVISVIQLIYATAGLLANPDFATGAAATSVRVLGVDFNGWHAAAGLALFAPGLLAARRTSWATAYALAAIAALLGTATWTSFDTRPAAVLWFPHATADTLFHIGSAAVLAAVLAVHVLRARTAASGPSCKSAHSWIDR